MGQWWARLPRNTKIAVGVGGAAVTFLVYRWYKARKAAAASSSSTTGTTSTTGTSSPSSSGYGTAPSVTVTTPQGSYSGPPGQLGSVLPVLSGSTGTPPFQSGTVPVTAAPAPTTSTAPAPPPSAPSTAPNLPPLQTINGQQYYVLGQVGQPAPGGGFEYSGYNVGGGSQVFYGNQNGVAQGTPVPGGFAYTPVGNAGLISAQPTTTAEVIH